MKFDIIKLFFTSPLHLSRGQTEFYDKSETVLHSDTIKSAIFSCAKQIYGDKIDKSFLEKIKVSSAFPFIDNEYFFPKPLINIDIKINGVDDGPKTHKKLKKIEYLSKNVFQDLINANLKEIDNEQISENEKYLFDNVNNKKSILKSEVQQRLVMPKGKEISPTPFYFDRIFFNKNAGLFFIVEYNDDETKKIFLHSLKLLEEQGIGTDKNVGNGHFYFEEDCFELKIAEEENSLITNLSLYLPTKDEVKRTFNDNAKYKLLKRGGYISNPENEEFITFRKKSIYMIKEGAVFENIGQKGEIANLKPDNVDIHDIYRDGTSIFIPVKTL